MKAKLLLSLLALGSISLSGCYLDLGFIKIGSKDEDTDEASGDKLAYYKNCDLTLTGGRLLNELQKLSWETHTNWITYSQVTSYYVTTSKQLSVDAVAEGSKSFQLFYTGKEVTSYNSNIQNREHVWPCANSGTLWTHDKPESGGFNPNYVDQTYYVGGGSDLYHVRPCDGTVNTARGNSRFVDFDDPEFSGKKDQTYESTESGGKWSLRLYGSQSSTTFANQAEPDDNMKGDVARLGLYIYMHYTERGVTPSGSVKPKGSANEFKYFDMTGSLPLTNYMGYQSEDKCKEVLKLWNKLDPVSDVEKLRNNTVQKIQGNRNPFVDYPELVDQIFE